MVEAKDATLIPKYYHPEFICYTNGEEIAYPSFLSSHEEYYATSIQYQIEFEEKTLVEKDNKVAGRVWITITPPGGSPQKLEVILIGEYLENKLYRLWELTYPDWSSLPAFESSL